MPTDGPAGKKVAYIDEIQYIPVPEESVRADGVGTGEYHYGDGSLAPDSYARVKGVPNVEADIGKPYYWAVAHMNKKEGLFTNVKLRQAVLAAMQVDPIAAAAFGVKEFYRIDPGHRGARDALVPGRGQRGLQPPGPGQGEGAPQGGRLRRHADPLDVHEGVLLQLQRRRGLQAAARGGRLQGRSPGDGLGDAGQAALGLQGVRHLRDGARVVLHPILQPFVGRHLAGLVDAAGEERASRRRSWPRRTTRSSSS